MTTTAKLIGRLAMLDAEIKTAKEQYAETLAALREVCEHPTLLETGWQQLEWFADLLPLRICEDCGLEEEAWSFRVLTGRAYRVARHELYGARKHGPITRVKR